MIRLRRASVLAMLTIAAGTLLPAQNASLRAGFENPPHSAAALLLVVAERKTTEGAITRDLTAMKAKGHGTTNLN